MLRGSGAAFLARQAPPAPAVLVPHNRLENRRLTPLAHANGEGAAHRAHHGQQQFQGARAPPVVQLTSLQLVRRKLLLAPSLHKQVLTSIDASPLLLRVVNSPVLKLPHPLDIRRLQTAVEALLQELPIIGGRLRKLSKAELSSHAASHPHLRAAPYCIHLPPISQPAAGKPGDAAGSNGSAEIATPVCVSVLLAEARSSSTTAELGLNEALAAGCFSHVARRVQLPPWYQPLDMTALLKGAGNEPLLKLQLTHTADGGCVLAATMPHLLVDSHSSTLLLRRLSQLYQQTGSGQAQSATPLPAVVTVPAAAWSKDALLPSKPAGTAASCQDPAAVLQALSLGLQSVDRPRLGSTLKALAAAFSSGLAASKLFPRPTDLTSLLLTIPADDTKRIRALASAHQPNISLNDTLSALVWLTFCQLRQRPLPGTTSSSTAHSSSGSRSPSNPLQRMLSRFSGSSKAMTAAAQQQPGKTSGSGVLGMAIDLRQNCSDLKQQLPPDYFGNAAWCLHLAATSTATGSSLDGSSTFVPALQAAAASVRAALQGFRGTAACGDTLLQLVQAQQAAPASVTVRNLCRLAVEVDAFITSWSFPVRDIDFGGGPAVEFSAVVRPTPPWQAAVLPQLLPKQQGPARAVQLLLTVPASAVAALQTSPVLRELVPGAVFGR